MLVDVSLGWLTHFPFPTHTPQHRVKNHGSWRKVVVGLLSS
jgi:hypothetical protein